MYFKCSTSAVGLLHEYFPKSAFHVVRRNSRAIWQVFTLEYPRMRLEVSNVSNVVGTPYEYLERNWNEVGMKLEYISCWNAVGKF